MTVKWRRGFLCAIFFFALTVPALRSHDPITTKLTWTQEISRVVYKRCAACHRPGGAAFSLLKYEEARPWAKAIRDQVRSRTMPPWGAVKGIGEFQHDPSLSEPEIEMIISWVEGGAPEGEPAYLSSPPAAVKPAPSPRFSREVKVKNVWEPAAPVSIAAIRPSGPAEAWITRKSGAVERLLWVNNYSKLSPRQYVFRNAILLRPGDKLQVTAPLSLALQ